MSSFEEGTWAAWLYDLLKPQVAKLAVCDPRKNAQLKEGKQERQDRRTQARRSAARRISAPRLPPPQWATKLEGSRPNGVSGWNVASCTIRLAQIGATVVSFDHFRPLKSLSNTKIFAQGVAMAERAKVTCQICWRRVAIDECKTDDYGHSVHEECYVAEQLWLRTRASFLNESSKKNNAPLNARTPEERS